MRRYAGWLLPLLLTACTLPLVWEPQSTPMGERPPTSEFVTVGALSPTPVSQPTPTPIPDTPLPSPSALPDPTTSPLTPTPTPIPMRFVLQPGNPVAVADFGHTELGCNWMGVAGQVFDMRGRPIQSLVVEAGGTLAGAEVRALGVTGGAGQYGEGGYELKLSDRVLGSEGTLWVQVFSLSGEPLSERVFFDTYAACDRNLILVNFIERPVASHQSFLPAFKKLAP